MKLFTSYYANYRNIPKSYLCIGISRVCPEWFANNDLDNFMFFKSNVLAPSESLLNRIKANQITQEQYKKEYVEKLYADIQKYFNCNDLGEWAKKMLECFKDTQWDGIVLMCYERPEEFCHRHIIRNILNKIYHIDCKEYGAKEENIEINKALF